MYAGIACILFGEAVLFESLLLYGSLVVLLFHAFIRFYEEPILTRTFGDAYTAYCDTIPRWIPSQTSFRRLWKKISGA